jgi:glycosyltransferase involved in cell wall biosynthesis
MRIAIVYDMAYPWVKGGGERIVHEVATRLAARHDVHVFSLRFWPGPPVHRAGDGVTRHGAGAALPAYRGGRRSIVQAAWAAVRLPLALARAGRFDVVDCVSTPYLPLLTTAALARRRGLPVVSTWLEVWQAAWRDYLPAGGALAARLERAAAARPARLLAISDATSAGLRAMGVSPDRIRVVPPGVDWAAAQGADARPGGPDVLYVGRLVRDKGVDLLLEAVAELHRSGARVTGAVVGDGPDRARLERRGRRLGLDRHVRFGGWLGSAADVLGAMRSARVLALPSRREGFGLVALEAAACGVPVITVDVAENAAAGLVRAGRFGEVVPRDAGSLAAAIRGLLGDPERRAALGAAGRAFTAGRDWHRTAARYEAEYAEAAGGG